MKKNITIFFMIAGFLLTASCKGKKEENKEGQKQGVYFIEPKDGAEVSNPVKVKIGIQGMEVVPAGELKEGTGHHHILVDGADFIEKGKAIPFDDKHLHLGKGETEAELNLTPGEHTLTLQFADGEHKSYGKEWAQKIKIVVKEAKEESTSEASDSNEKSEKKEQTSENQ